MAICYLCGESMIDRQVYFADTTKFEKIPKLTHEEHIIQNAIYGRLTDKNILCETCGSRLSDEIDSNFVKLFDGFTLPINHILASKDHGKLNKTLSGHLVKKDGSKTEVQIRNGKVTPKKPEYEFIKEKQLVKIYANDKTIKQYQVFVLKDLQSKGIDPETLTIEPITDMQEYNELGIHFSEGVENFNEKFKLGFNKIATSFAISKGVSREQLTSTLDITNKQLIFTNNVIPFFPSGILDQVIEPFRVVLEPEFPTHTLILYSDDDVSGLTKLVCYIDLFSTFQFYVILNHDYKGEPVHETYYQTIIRQEKPEIKVRNTRWKHLPIIAEAIGVDKSEMAGMNIDQMYDFLEKKYNQYTAEYTLDLDAYVHRVAGRVAMNLAIKGKGFTSHLSEIEKQILEATPDLDTEDMLCLYHELQRVEDGSPELFYKKDFITSEQPGSPFLYSTLMKMIELNNSRFDGFKSYSHTKFYLLTHFVHANEPKKEDRARAKE